MGIEPTLSAWKAEVLPLNYTRIPLVGHFLKIFLAHLQHKKCSKYYLLAN